MQNSDKKQKTFKMEFYSLLITIILTFSGYLFTHYQNVSLNEDQYRQSIQLKQLEAELERTNEQLRYVYGPLYALTQSIDRTWVEFRKRHRTGGGAYFSKGITEEDKMTWRIWFKSVWMDQYEMMDEIILKYSDLIDGDQLPEELLLLSAHIAGYRAVMKRWEENDFSRHLSFFNYPNGITKYAKEHYLKLKKKQQKLLGELK